MHPNLASRLSRSLELVQEAFLLGLAQAVGQLGQEGSTVHAGLRRLANQEKG
jgi:hypothetical protein